ncbi:MAG: polysulfide reductase NrfD [Thermodesulfobacteria bacterium]|nr:polysulfide reductase NrfD [Thermodesulfobacteriota bacterium]
MAGNNNSWFKEKILMGRTWGEFIRDNITIGNFIALLFILWGIYCMVYRIIAGMGPTTNLSDDYPWGLWIGFDILVGIALAAPGLTVGTAVHLFGLEEYHDFARPAVLSSLVGYIFAVFALLFDLGRYYRIFYLLGYSWGFTSILFLIGWHFFLYINISIIEFAPVVCEWLDWPRARKFFNKLTIWATIFGVIIAGGHQSALGGLFLVMPEKLHPLWYSAFLPPFFLLSAIFGGICMVIFESTITHRALRHLIPHHDPEDFDRKIIGLGKAAASAMYIYLILKLLDFAHYHKWIYLKGFYGFWYLFELIGFVLIPALMITSGVRMRRAIWVKIGAVLAILGVILNRLNVCIIAFKWYVPFSQKYYPAWTEVGLSAGVVAMLIVTYRFIVNRMPVLFEHPKYKSEH